MQQDTVLQKSLRAEIKYPTIIFTNFFCTIKKLPAAN